MPFSKNIEDYHELWEDRRYFLAPILPSHKLWGIVEYIPWRREAIHYGRPFMPPELAAEIVQRMIDSGCEVLSGQPDHAEHSRTERLWADRKDEFVIIKTINSLRPYKIYHPAYQQWLPFAIDDEPYNLIVKNMLEAGVPLWDHSK